jgi:hypothetical protein
MKMKEKKKTRLNPPEIPVDIISPSGLMSMVRARNTRGDSMKVRVSGFILLFVGLSLVTGCDSPTTPTTRTPPPPVNTPWSNSGTGDTAFDMPTYVSRVRITGTYTGYSSNFMVRVGGVLLVNELLGTYWRQTYFDGTYKTTGGATTITLSGGVYWTFTAVYTTKQDTKAIF